MKYMFLKALLISSELPLKRMGTITFVIIPIQPNLNLYITVILTPQLRLCYNGNS